MVFVVNKKGQSLPVALLLTVSVIAKNAYLLMDISINGISLSYTISSFYCFNFIHFYTHPCSKKQKNSGNIEINGDLGAK